MLDAYAFGRGNLDFGQVGGGLDYSHRLTDDLSAFLRGEVGYQYGPQDGLMYSGLGGVRLRF